jgi:hypothetical protein
VKIQLPNNWSPRDYQKPLWDYLKKKHKGDIGKRAVVSWHRRSGKDAVMLNHNACAAFERIGNYWYMLPEYSQCRKAIWDAVNPHTGKKRIDEAFPEQLRSNTLNQEMKIIFKNGSSWQLMGSDNYDSLVGSTPIGTTFSEYALSNPNSWGFIRPILLENGGWSIFNSTPRGKNHFYNLMNLAGESKDWFSQVLTADQTDVFNATQLSAELKEYQSEHGEAYGKALWLQEYFCSFDAALPGSIWGESLADVAAQERICYVPHTDGYPVHSAWDLGRNDDTAIWFFQIVGSEINIIDCFACNFKEPDFYADMLYNKKTENGWRYGINWLPHDAKPVKLGMGGKGILQQFLDLKDHYIDSKNVNIGDFAITPNVSKQDGINAARKTLKFCKFDEINTRDGVESLKAYRRKYDEEKKLFSNDPVHDGFSHYADAFRYLSLVWKFSKEKQVILSQEQKFEAGNVVNVNFGDLKKAHFAKMRRQRNR